jgi:hypothetical protein
MCLPPGPNTYLARTLEAQVGGGGASRVGALRCVRAREPVVRHGRRRPHHQGSKQQTLLAGLCDSL